MIKCYICVRMKSGILPNEQTSMTKCESEKAKKEKWDWAQNRERERKRASKKTNQQKNQKRIKSAVKWNENHETRGAERNSCS